MITTRARTQTQRGAIRATLAPWFAGVCAFGCAVLASGASIHSLYQPERADAGSALSALFEAPDATSLGDDTRPDEINSIAAPLREVGGAVMDLTESGVIAVASGRGFYDPAVLDTARGRIDQREAQLRALADARRSLTRLLSGSELRSEITSSLEAEQYDRMNATGASVRATETEITRSASVAVLSGVAVYSVEDRPDLGEVIVTIASTPVTRGVAGPGDLSGVAISMPIGMALERIRWELTAGVTPPSGSRVCVDPRTGETVWIGYGADVVRTGGGALAGEYRRAAMESAELSARRHLLAMLTGERVELESEIERRSATLDMELSRVGGQDLSDTQIVRELRERDARSVEGELPPGVSLVRFTSEDGVWQHAMVWFSPAAPAAPGAQDALATDARTPTVRGSDRDAGARERSAPAPVPAPAPAQAPAPSRDDCGPDNPEEGLYPRLAEGVGSTLNEAIRDAISSALLGVNGGFLKEQSAIETRLRQAITETTASLESVGDLSRLDSRNIEVATEGMIAGFDILDQRVQADGGRWVKLCVKVRRFDKTARAAKPAQIMLLPSASDADGGWFQLFEDRVRASSAGEVFSGELVPMLNNSRFSVIERDLLGMADAELARIAAEVDRGRMGAGELAGFGLRVGAEYVCIPKIFVLEGERNRRQVGRDLFQIEETLRVRVSLRVVDVATGESVSPPPITISWGPVELKRLRDAGQIADQFSFALYHAARDASGELLIELDRHEIERYFIPPEQAVGTVLRAPSGADRTVRLRLGPAHAAEGQVLEVYRLEKEAFGGKLEWIPTRLGTIRLRGMFPGSTVATAELLDGEVEVGAVCFPGSR